MSERKYLESTEKFHNAIVNTLDALPEKEQAERHYFGKNLMAVGIAAALILGLSVCASGLLIFRQDSWSRTETDYTSLPSAEQCMEEFGFVPKCVEEFSTGFKFSGGNTVYNETYDENGVASGEYKSLSCVYSRGDTEVTLRTGKASEDWNEWSDFAGEYGGIELFSRSQKLILVPSDSEITDEDREKLKNGDFNFSFGSYSLTDEDIREIQAGECEAVFSYVEAGEGVANQKSVSWIEDGIGYRLSLVSKNNVNINELLEMAKELIDME